MAGNEKQKASVADAQTKKGGSAHSCGGKLQKWFDGAKNSPNSHGAVSVLADALRNGSPGEKEAAKSAIASKLGNAKDIFAMVKDLVESGDGDPGMRGCLTSCFSSMLKSREGIGRMDTLAGTLDEAVLKEVIKCVADTNDPAALGFIIRASRKCPHPVGAWQAPKVATPENADIVRAFVQEEAAKQPPALRDKILDSAMREFGNRGVEFAAPHAESSRQPEPAAVQAFLPTMQPFQAREPGSRDFQPDAPPPSAGTAAPVQHSQARPSAEGGMDFHVRNVEAFYRNYGMVSGTRRRATILEGEKAGGVVPEPEIHSLEAERRGTAAIPGNDFVSKSENGPQETPPAPPRRARTNRPGKGRPQNADSKAKRAAIAEPTAQDSLPKRPSQEKTAQGKPSGPHAQSPHVKTRKNRPNARASEQAAAPAGETASAGTRKGALRVPKPQSKIRPESHALRPKAAAGAMVTTGGTAIKRKPPVPGAPARAIASRRKASVRGAPARGYEAKAMRVIAPKRKQSVSQPPVQRAQRKKAARRPERRKAPVPEKLKGEGKSNAPRAAQKRKKPRQKTGPERARTQLFSGSLAGELKKANAQAAAPRPRNRSKPRGKTLLERLAEMKKKRRQRRVALMLLMEKRKKKAKGLR